MERAVTDRGRLVALLIGLLVSACGGSSATPPNHPIPTEADAKAFVGRLVDLARAGDLEGLCALSEPGCERSLANAGPGTVPVTPPVILDTWVLASRVEGNQEIIGGLVVRLCGLNGLGVPYQGEVLVETADDGLKANDAVFWSGLRVAGPAATVPLPSWAAILTASCPK